MLKLVTLFVGSALMLVAYSSHAGFTQRSWPNGVCTGTLQACVDVSDPGDEILVNTDVAIAESIAINKGLRLTGGYGFAANFASGHGIFVNTPATGNLELRIRRLRFTNARVDVQHGGSGLATVYVEDNQFRSVGAVAAGIRVRGLPTAGRVIAYVSHNTLDVAAPTLLDAAIEVELGSNGAAGNSSAKLDFNSVRATADSLGWGVLVSAIAGTTSSAMVFNNQVRGRFSRGALMLSEGFFSNTPSTLTTQVVNNVIIGKNRGGSGVLMVVNRGTVNSTLLNNTIVHLAFGVMQSQWCCDNTASAQITTKLQNNLIASNDYGLRFQSTGFGFTLSEFTNLLFGNNSNVPAAHASRIVSDPLLDDARHPGLRTGSPAIGAGQMGGAGGAIDYDVYYTGNGLPRVDADGLRRVKGGGAVPILDIGAYEHGDEFARVLNPNVTVPALFPHSFAITNDNIADAQTSRLQANLYAGGANGDNLISSFYPMGVWWFGSWNLFHEDSDQDMPLRIRFNVFAPDPTGVAFAHAAAVGETLAYTAMDANDFSESAFAMPIATRIVNVTHNWNPSGNSGVYNDHFIGIAYDNASARWRVHQLDGSDVPDGASFNVHSVMANPNAFLLTADTGSNIFFNEIELDHVLLNDVPCARFIATPVHGLWGSSGFDIYYSSARKRWRLYRFAPAAVADGAAAHILIDAKQTAMCRELLQDGFED